MDVAGGGALHESTVGPLRYRNIVVHSRLPFRNRRFVDCQLPDWRASQLAMHRVTFERCHLIDWKVAWAYGITSMIGCRVTGVLRTVLSGKHRVEGNDFSQMRGIVFTDGIPLDGNRFASDGTQLIVSRDHRAWAEVEGLAHRGDVVAENLTKALAGKQSWSVLYRRDTDAADWSFYTEHFGGVAGASEAPPSELLMPSLGQGQVAFCWAFSDEDARDSVLSKRPGQLFEAQLTPAGLVILGQVLGLAPDRTIAPVASDEHRALFRLETPFLARLRAVGDHDRLLRQWVEGLEHLEEGEWADDPAAVLEELITTVQRSSEDRLYAVLIA